MGGNRSENNGLESSWFDRDRESSGNSESDKDSSGSRESDGESNGESVMSEAAYYGETMDFEPQQVSTSNRTENSETEDMVVDLSARTDSTSSIYESESSAEDLSIDDGPALNYSGAAFTAVNDNSTTSESESSAEYSPIDDGLTLNYSGATFNYSGATFTAVTDSSTTYVSESSASIDDGPTLNYRGTAAFTAVNDNSTTSESESSVEDLSIENVSGAACTAVKRANKDSGSDSSTTSESESMATDSEESCENIRRHHDSMCDYNEGAFAACTAVKHANKDSDSDSSTTSENESMATDSEESCENIRRHHDSIMCDYNEGAFAACTAVKHANKDSDSDSSTTSESESMATDSEESCENMRGHDLMYNCNEGAFLVHYPIEYYYKYVMDISD